MPSGRRPGEIPCRKLVVSGTIWGCAEDSAHRSWTSRPTRTGAGRASPAAAAMATVLCRRINLDAAVDDRVVARHHGTAVQVAADVLVQPARRLVAALGLLARRHEDDVGEVRGRSGVHSAHGRRPVSSSQRSTPSE